LSGSVGESLDESVVASVGEVSAGRVSLGLLHPHHSDGASRSILTLCPHPLSGLYPDLLSSSFVQEEGLGRGVWEI
jgi:hypothetical protein